ncbi:MAG: amidohydrolase family protein [Candidatus Omnitrophica bacterium]|nr:amidohydrolase family protein [Candidatus Omnitrophota bacterium]MCM8802093.1 amidohydrolase family protein [Candidatus Omnitrophota bacterium]
MRIIDIHTHAFPDNLAEKVIHLLEQEGKIKAVLDGKISSLISSMDKYGIDRSVICLIATKITQYESILKWAKEIKSDRIIPFVSFHQDDPLALKRIEEIKKEGFKGIKLHPYYQKFVIDEEEMMKIYEKICKEDLILVLHTGFDFAFERIRIADPEKVINIKKTFPKLKLVTTHFGGWKDWENVERFIIGKEIYMEISFSLEFLEKERARRMLLSHPSEYILFGTDSPWTDQGNTLNLLKELKLPSEIEEKILYINAEKLLFKRE